MERIKYITLGIAFILILGVAGRHDRAEEILAGVTYELYHEIKKELGESASDVQIAEYYLVNKVRFDSLAEANGWF